MPRTITLVTLLSLTCAGAIAQNTGSKQKKTEEPAPNVSKTTYIDQPDTAVENHLVALAMAGPTFKASAHQNRINELELRRAKSAWLNLLTISSSYYDQSANKTAVGGTTFVYPKYYFSLSVPLGIIFSQGNQVKTARESLALTKERQEDLSRSIRTEVLTKYKQYKYYTSLIAMQGEMINDVVTVSSQVEDNFKKGQASVDAYINAQKNKNEEMAKLMNLKLQQDLLKLDIEKMIGVPLETVLRAPK